MVNQRYLFLHIRLTCQPEIQGREFFGESRDVIQYQVVLLTENVGHVIVSVGIETQAEGCLLYTSDAADDTQFV